MWGEKERQIIFALTIYVASFPFSQQLALGSLIPGSHGIQTSGGDGEQSVTMERVKHGSGVMLELGHSRTENTDARWPPSLREMFSKRATHKKKILSHLLVSSSLSTSFILFYVAYQRDLRLGEFAISHGERKVLFHATVYVPPEQPKQLHFLNPNATGDLTLQSWFSCLYLSRLTFLPSPSLCNRAACCSLSNHNHALLSISPSSLRIILPFLFSLFTYSCPYRGHLGEVQQSPHISGCACSSTFIPPSSSTWLLDAHNPVW